MSAKAVSWVGDIFQRIPKRLSLSGLMAQVTPGWGQAPATKLTGRAFYESIGSPKMIVAPMVDRSEFAWRLLTRSYLDQEQSKSLLAYTPMIHARLFSETARFRDEHFQPTRGSLVSTDRSSAPPWLDGNPQLDRPLFVQFCANKPEELLEAAQYVAPYCDAVDLNLGCPQGIAKAGRYGAFLQEDWATIYQLIHKLHTELPIPVTAKMRILETKEKTLEYAKMILSAGASILTVHGRRREQKGHYMGVADWSVIRYLRDNLPPDTVLFANGNILNPEDLEPCLAATGADGVMSAEGNLSNPAIFAHPPTTPSREYWYGLHGLGGYRIDGVFRRYMDIIHKYVLEKPPPERPPLYLPGDLLSESMAGGRPSRAPDKFLQGTKRKRGNNPANRSPSLVAMQGHLFQLLKPMLSTHTDIRDALAKCRLGDIDAFEHVLSMVEDAVKGGLDEEAAAQRSQPQAASEKTAEGEDATTPSQRTIAKYKRPWWVCQPHIRPLPEEALKLGSITLSKREKAKAEMEKKMKDQDNAVQPSDDLPDRQRPCDTVSNELPKAALVCG